LAVADTLRPGEAESRPNSEVVRGGAAKTRRIAQMIYGHFDPPGGIDDFAADPSLPGKWNSWLSSQFDISTVSVNAFLQKHGGGTCQFYNPVTHGLPTPDLPRSSGDITWNGFPKRFAAMGPSPTRYADAEPPRDVGQARVQDEYLEWYVNWRDNKILSIHFTCEAWDYFDFLGQNAPARVLQLYQQYVSPAVQHQDLFGANGTYNRLNKWNTQSGAMHLTHSANNLFAEVFLAASATVRRQNQGVELTSSIPLINCAQYGDPARNSDPNIGIAVNGLAREGRMITLANPVGLYMAQFDGSGLTLNGNPAGGFFTVVRGAFPLALRAVYQLPPELSATGLTVSDVKIGAKNIEFGGEFAERITMHLIGAASVAQTTHNTPEPCGAIQQVDTGTAVTAALALPRLPSRKA
jgi:hypothetical protein